MCFLCGKTAAGNGIYRKTISNMANETITAGLKKNAIESSRQRRVCPSCGRAIQARVCKTFSG